MFTEIGRVKTLRRTDDQRVTPCELNRPSMAVPDINKVISETNMHATRLG